MNQYMAKHRIDHVDMEKWDKFLEAANVAAGLVDGDDTSHRHNYMRDYARDSYRFHRYSVTVPWGPVWTGRKR